MKCQKCHTENKSHAKFCIKCGAPLNSQKPQRNYRLIATAVIAVVLIAIVVFIGFSLSNNGSSEHYIEIDGVSFNVPQEGYYKNSEVYRLNYTGHQCAVKKVESFESLPSEKTISSTDLGKYYDGGESYVSHGHDTGNTWYGIKIKKDDSWFHITVLTYNKEEAYEFLDWMYEHNDWEGHQ